MKTSILNLLALSLIVTFAASCGKKSESGSSKANPVYAPYTIPGAASVVGTTGHNELINWVNTADTATGMRAFFVKKSGSMFGWLEQGVCQMVGINVLCNKPTSCLISNGLAVDIGTTVFGSGGLRPQSCTLSGTFYNKATDTALRESILGKAGRVVLADKTEKSGSIYTVYYTTYVGNTVVSGAAQINTSLPAALNPIILEENNQRTKTYFLPY
jgi:hypothetical protein